MLLCFLQSLNLLRYLSFKEYFFVFRLYYIQCVLQLLCSRYSLFDLDLFLIIKGYLEEKVDLFILNIYGYVKFFRSERNLVKLLYG